MDGTSGAGISIVELEELVGASFRSCAVPARRTDVHSLTVSIANPGWRSAGCERRGWVG